MKISYTLSVLILAALITLIYLFLFISVKLFLWDQKDGTIPHFRHNGVSWNWFVTSVNNKSMHVGTKSIRVPVPVLKSMCNSTIVSALLQPRLTQEEYEWCLWSKSPTGGNVNPTTLWGNFASDERSKWKYRHLQCESINSRSESCSDVEGDGYIQRWKKSRVLMDKLSCDRGRHSSQMCYQNNSDLFCELQHVMIDFSKYRNSSRVNRFGETLKLRSFDQDFISSDCRNDVESDWTSVLPIGQVYSPRLSSDKCDVTLTDPVLLYSHDYIENFGHTLSDMMYVWQMLWLSGLASSASTSVDLLSVDGIFGDRSYDDTDSPFYMHYRRHFRRLLLGREFRGQRVCIDKLYLPPRPNDFYLFHLWHADDKCNLMGPSSLFQRYNLHVRGLFTSDGAAAAAAAAATAVSGAVPGDVRGSNGEFRIVVIVRRETDNLGGTSSKTSRLMLNLDQVKATMKETATHIRSVVGDDTDVDVVFQDLRLLSYERQLQLIGRTNILVGMHGAGIPQSLHMSIGTLDKCCGVIEMFPAGEFSIIRAYGNMARRMGLRYDRIDISANESHSHGASVPVQELSEKVLDMVHLLHHEPTCILPIVAEDPFLES